MKYYFSKIIDAAYDTAIERVTADLKIAGFGIVSEIKMHEKFKDKLGVDFKKYTILGACNPAYAYKVIQEEEKVGTMLPCNIVIIDQGNSNTEIVAINPIVSMMAIENKSLEPYANEVTNTLKELIENL